MGPPPCMRFSTEWTCSPSHVGDTANVRSRLQSHLRRGGVRPAAMIVARTVFGSRPTRRPTLFIESPSSNSSSIWRRSLESTSVRSTTPASEDHTIIGGLGSASAEVVADEGIPCRVRSGRAAGGVLPPLRVRRRRHRSDGPHRPSLSKTPRRKIASVIGSWPPMTRAAAVVSAEWSSTVLAPLLKETSAPRSNYRFRIGDSC